MNNALRHNDCDVKQVHFCSSLIFTLVKRRQVFEYPLMYIDIKKVYIFKRDKSLCQTSNYSIHKHFYIDCAKESKSTFLHHNHYAHIIQIIEL